MRWQDRDIQLDFEYKLPLNLIRFNCSECGKLIFGVEHIRDKDLFKKTIDVVDPDAVLTCGTCLSK